MKPADLQKLSEKVNAFMEERDWDQFHSVKNLSMALSVEVSELVELFQWLTEEKSNRIKEDPILLAKVEEEIADIAIYLIRLLEKTDINLEQAVSSKMEKNRLKYPADLAKGSARKYTDLK